MIILLLFALLYFAWVMPVHLVSGVSQLSMPTKKHIRWLSTANDGYLPYPYTHYKEHIFYPFKADFLRKHGNFREYARQEISAVCWRCNGSGKDPYESIHDPIHSGYNGYCVKCCGSGYYYRHFNWLAVWEIHGHEFMVPLPRGAKPLTYHVGQHFREIKGRVPLGSFPSSDETLQSIMLLLLVFDVGRFCKMVIGGWKFRIKYQWQHRNFHIHRYVWRDRDIPF